MINEMMGFKTEELIEMMKKQEITHEKIEELLPIMKENYDGYKFSIDAEERMYNSNMTLYFLNEYIGHKKIPNELVDVNIASDYAKIGNMLKLCKGKKRLEILKTIVLGEGILTKITQKFNPEMEFTDKEISSMLYYLGYLTIDKMEFGMSNLIIPNKMMREIYLDYFQKVINDELEIKIDVDYVSLMKEIVTPGNIENVMKLLKEYLTNLSNRDYQGFDEKYLKLMFYQIVMNFRDIYNVKSEMEVQRKYPDILLISKEKDKNYYSIIIEFKYLKKKDEKQLEEKRQEAKVQIEEFLVLRK